MSLFKKYSYFWLTLVLFVGSLMGHWTFAWYAYVREQTAHQQPINISDYVIETARDTFGNWQSEFRQSIWQVGGLAFFLFISSPQSKEGDDRREEKLDIILSKLDPNQYEQIGRSRKYPKS
jgi:hypothetical protein